MAKAVAGSLLYDTEIDSTKLKKQLDKAKQELSKLGNDIKKGFSTAATVIGGVTAAMVGLEQATREYRTDLSRLETNTKVAGKNFDDMKDSLFGLVALTDETDSSVEALSNLLQTGFTQTGMEKALESLKGAVISFPDTLKIEGLADGLQETLATGQAIGPFSELLERMGINLDTFNQGLTEAIKNGDQENYILQILAETGLAEVNAEYEKNNEGLLAVKESQIEFTDALAELGEVLSPIIEQVISYGTEIVKSISNAITKFTEYKEIITLFGIAVGTVTALVIAYKVQQALATAGLTAWQAISLLATTATTGLGTAFTFLTSPIGLVILAIGSLIAIGYLLVENWDKIKEVATKVFGYIKDFGVKAVEKVKEAFSSAFDIGKNLVQGIWNGINDAKDWVLDKIKGFGDAILDGLKSFFGIESPSKLMRDEIGKFLPQGIAVGIDADTDKALESVDKMSDKIYDEMQSAMNFENAKMSVGGISGTVSQILTAQNNQTISVNSTLELDGEKIATSTNKVNTKKDLQYSFS